MPVCTAYHWPSEYPGQARLSAARTSKGPLPTELAKALRKTTGVAQMMPFRIGAGARCTDGACGQVTRIIVNPVTRKVTYLAISPKHPPGLGRLVPADLVDATTRQVQLGCTLAEFQALPPSEETEAVPDLDPTGHPHYVSARKTGLRTYPWMIRDSGGPEAPRQATVDSVPSGGVEVHRELIVCATDGEIGQVRGLVADPDGHQVTHVLLQRGHMPGRKDVAIPISAVTKIGTLLIHLSLTKHQVKDLPPVDID